MDARTRSEMRRLLSNGRYTLWSSTGRRRGEATVTSLSYASATPLLVMAAVDPRSRLFDCLAESRIAHISISRSTRVLHCLVRHIVRLSARAIVILEVVTAECAA
jgi:flavin reductase (DIM6/NTAB) family NADH-FMN oxidoreductase RutF